MNKILKYIEHIQRWVLVGLSILCTLLLFLLCVQIIVEFTTLLLQTNIKDISLNTIFNILGSFLTALIIIELIENISAYLKDHVLNVEVAVTTALIAVSRKIIIFESEAESYLKLLSLGVAILSLALAYYLLHRSHSDKTRTLLGTSSISSAMGKRRSSDTLK
jgi:uncharacterized membrane protein (DUF373 family)